MYARGVDIMKYVYLLLFLLLSCQPKQNDFKYLEAYIYNNWIDADAVEANYPKSFSATKSVTEPQMTWKNILRVTTRDYVDCLFYRIPHKRLSRGKGIIKIFRIKKKESCSRSLEKKSEILIEGVSHFKAYFTSKNEKNLISKSEFKAFHLYISASRTNDKDFAIVLPLHNVSSRSFHNPNKVNRKKNKFKRYDEPWRDGLLPGLKLFSGNYKPKIKTSSTEEISFDYAQDRYKFCYRVTKECKVTQEFECGKCKKGWYSIVDYNCAKGGSKLCGRSECGRRNQPACPRGTNLEELESNNYCFRGSTAGICEEGLETYCDGNQVLVCR